MVTSFMIWQAWEWCADLYDNAYYSTINTPSGVKDPHGPAKNFDPEEAYATKRAIRGRSFLCNDSYCQDLE